MSYSLPSTSFTRRELATIQRRPIRALLPSNGFTPEHAAEVVFTKTSGGGLGSAAFICRTRLKDLRAATTHLANSPRTNDGTHSSGRKLQWSRLRHPREPEAFTTSKLATGYPLYVSSSPPSECTQTPPYRVCLRRVHDRSSWRTR
jgi:hypothetical protein